MKNQIALLSAAIIAGALTLPLAFAGTSQQATYPGHQYAGKAKISLAKARATALRVFPGKIVSEELEKENGGSGLRYSFDIKSGKTVHEVGVDAKTGKLLENSGESGEQAESASGEQGEAGKNAEAREQGEARQAATEMTGSKAKMSKAKISLSQARAIALKAFSGKVVSEELENEEGGSGMRYSFDIKRGKVVHEVGVDAMTGKVVENDTEND
jgi:uncharacterized membrane protein YkoI